MAITKYKRCILQITKAKSHEDAEDRVEGIKTIPGHIFSYIFNTSKGIQIHSIFDVEGGPQRGQRIVYWPIK